jgi:ADP-heptose:LPS heptosyltransferase
MLKQLWRKYGINPFDTLLKQAQKKGDRRFLICWNRGLGDIPLGLYALVQRIRNYIPEAQITFVTRSDLKEGFSMLEGVSILVDSEWKRGVPFDLDKTLAKAGLLKDSFDVILERPDPTRWLMWQLGKLVPQLTWNPKWDHLHTRFAIDSQKIYVGVHVQTETQYTYEKNWPVSYWKEFFQRTIEETGVEIILFGFSPTPVFEGKGILDLRGQTQLFDMLSIIKNCCRYLLVPDSGVLSLTYYINASFPIHIVSLWADPKQGVLRQNVPSPNPQLNHVPLIAKNKDLKTVQVDRAMHALFSGVRR